MQSQVVFDASQMTERELLDQALQARREADLSRKASGSRVILPPESTAPEELARDPFSVAMPTID